MESAPLLHQKPAAAAPRPNSKVFLLTCLIVFTFIEVGTFMLLIPQTWIYESILCNKYYSDRGMPMPHDEADCKIAPVQGELAKIRAVSASLAAIPGILLSVPYGQLADNRRIGRKMVLMLSYAGVLFQVYTELFVAWLSGSKGSSLRLVWLAPVWTVMGGGTGVLSAVVYTMITDVVDTSQRSTAFIYVSLSLQISQLAAPLVASWLMATSPWLAYVVSIVIITTGLPVLLISLPETVNIRPSQSDESSDMLGNDHEDIPFAVDHNPDSDSDSISEDIPQPKKRSIGDILRDYKFLKNSNIIILLSCSCLYWIGRCQMDLLVQYVSTRYGQSLSSAGFVLSMNAVITLILFLAILPFVTKFLQKNVFGRRTRRPRRLSNSSTSTSTSSNATSSAITDLWVLKGSIILLAIGCIAIGAAPTLSTMLVGDAIYVLGSGFDPVARGLLTLYVDKLHVARLHTLISIVQLFGLLLGGPLLAVLFDHGLSIGRDWTGLPFLGSGLLHLLLCLGVWCISVPAGVDTDAA